MAVLFGPVMKTSQRQTHYEILQVPMDAAPLEIRHAYLDVCELYQDKSMAAGAFFPDSERKAILSRLEEAYLVLINPESRSLYDRTLIETGIMKEGSQYQSKSRPVAPPYRPRSRRTYYQCLPKQPAVEKSVVTKNTRIQEILKKDLLTGRDLKAIRTELQIPLEAIVMQTRITLGTLEAIEEDQFNRLPPVVYLKSFLKLYAQCLQLDAQTVIRGYMNHCNVS